MITEQSPFQYLSLNKIVPSPTNKRRIRQDKLQELADNIKAHGVMQPILVRPMGKDGRAMFNAGEDVTPDHYEIVAGERRWRASQLADQVNIPAMVREMIDLDALQLQVFENLHRDDLHPMEEAEAFDQLLKRSQDLIGLTVDELALKVGKSRSYVYASLKLLDLCTYARDAFYDGKIGKETAVLLARIPGEKLQTQAVKEVTKPNYQGDGMSFRAAKQHLHDRYTLDLTEAPWDKHSTTLCQDAGSCLSCPKRSGNYPELFSDIESADVCTDPDCFTAKKAAHAQHLIDTAPNVIHGEEAKEIAPYGAHSFISKGYVSAEGKISHAGLWGTPQDLLGDDLPEPAILIDHNNTVIEVYKESALKQKLQEKIDAGELVVETAKPHEPSQWELENARKRALKETETADRKLLFAALHSKLQNMPADQLPIAQVLQLQIERAYGHLNQTEIDSVLETWGRSEQDYSDFLADRTAYPANNINDLSIFLIELLAAANIDAQWDYQNESVDDPEDLMFLLHSVNIDPNDVFNATQTASPPPSAAQAGESTAPATAEGGEPNPFEEIKAKALAKKARKHKKEEPATAGADHKASAATATEETMGAAA